MRFVFILLLMCCFFYSSFAQIDDQVFYDLIESNVTSQYSPLYYPILVSKFQNAPSDMTSEEKLHLYYGKKFHESYSPEEEHPLMTEIRNALFFENGISVDYQNIHNLCLQVTQDEVFNLDAMKVLIYTKSVMDGGADFYQKQYDTILEAIQESQQMVEDSYNFLVIDEGDIYHFLHFQKWSFLGENNLFDRSQKVYSQLGIQPTWIYFNIGAQLDYLANM